MNWEQFSREAANLLNEKGHHVVEALQLAAEVKTEQAAKPGTDMRTRGYYRQQAAQYLAIANRINAMDVTA